MNTKNELILNVNYIKSVNFDNGQMLDFTPDNYTDKFLYDEIGGQFYKRPLLKIATECETITLSFVDNVPAEQTYADLKKKLSSTERPFFLIDLNSTLYRVAHTL
jgi:hypothetical protein